MRVPKNAAAEKTDAAYDRMYLLLEVMLEIIIRARAATGQAQRINVLNDTHTLALMTLLAHVREDHATTMPKGKAAKKWVRVHQKRLETWRKKLAKLVGPPADVDAKDLPTKRG